MTFLQELRAAELAALFLYRHHNHSVFDADQCADLQSVILSCLGEVSSVVLYSTRDRRKEDAGLGGASLNGRRLTKVAAFRVRSPLDARGLGSSLIRASRWGSQVTFITDDGAAGP